MESPFCCQERTPARSNLVGMRTHRGKTTLSGLTLVVLKIVLRCSAELVALLRHSKLGLWMCCGCFMSGRRPHAQVQEAHVARSIGEISRGSIKPAVSDWCPCALPFCLATANVPNRKLFDVASCSRDLQTSDVMFPGHL